MDNKRTIMPNGIYTDDELMLLKSVFAENIPLVKIIRKVMLGLDIEEFEESQWKATFFENKPLKKLIRKMFLPTIDGDAPINQVVDLWLTVDISNKLPEEAASIVTARGLIIDYLDERLDVLLGDKADSKKLIDFDVKDMDDLRARRDIVMHIENMLNTINSLAGYKQETPEETIKRLEQNSNK